MQYAEGQLGRVFVVRIDDGEDFLATLQQFVQDRDVRAGSVMFLGAMRTARMVTGPEKAVIPPTPHFIMFEGGWEIFGFGTIFPDKNGVPGIHYHASAGRAGHALTGCLREKATTYLVVEAVVQEFTGLSVRREPDEKMKVNLPVMRREPEGQEPLEKNAEAIPSPATPPSPPTPEKKKDDDLPGGLAEIIRDLTRRPPS